MRYDIGITLISHEVVNNDKTEGVGLIKTSFFGHLLYDISLWSLYQSMKTGGSLTTFICTMR